uniref:phage tail protein n=1 Tax=Pseudomonas sp. MWU13-3659 TaxID=2986964 RepID=UPI002076235A
GKPTTLAGYGITDALHTGHSGQVPRFYSPVPGTTYQTPALEIREVNLVQEANRSWDYAPRIGFHWGGVTAGTLGMASGGQLCWNGNTIWDSANFNPNTKADKTTTLAGYGITDAIKRGDQGLGSSTAQVSSIDTIGLPGGFHCWLGGATSLANYCSVLNLPYTASNFSAQIAVTQGGPGVRVLARATTNDGAWTPTVEVFHTGNLVPDAIVPPGTMIQSFSRKAPTGTLRTNGAVVSRITFSRLFAEIGTLYGVGDGVSTFHLPDTRGLFTRDVDDGRGFDPGRVQGTFQASQNMWHNHPGSSVSISEAGAHPHTIRMGSNDVAGIYPDLVAPGGGPVQYTSAVNWAGAHTHPASITIIGDGGNESRPPNIALYTYIKY